MGEIRMTDSKQPKWREFWIREHGYGKWIAFDEHTTRTSTPSEIHVIEHAALLEAERTIAELKLEKEKLEQAHLASLRQHTKKDKYNLEQEMINQELNLQIDDLKFQLELVRENSGMEARMLELFEHRRNAEAERDQLTKEIAELKNWEEEHVKTISRLTTEKEQLRNAYAWLRLERDQLTKRIGELEALVDWIFEKNNDIAITDKILLVSSGLAKLTPKSDEERE